MQRLTLDVEMLAVESFEVAADPARRGTVQGLADPVDSPETQNYYSCPGTCGASPPLSMYDLECFGADLVPVEDPSGPPPPDCV